MNTARKLRQEPQALLFKEKMRSNFIEHMRSMPSSMSEIEKIHTIAHSTKLGKKWLKKDSNLTTR